MVEEESNLPNTSQLGGYDIICDINSMKNLVYGWNLYYTEEGFKKYEEKRNTKSCKVAVIGNANKGKSYILQKLAGDSFPTGFSDRTEGISVKYPKAENLNFILFDTAGTETPLIRTPYYDFEEEMSKYDAEVKLKKQQEKEAKQGEPSQNLFEDEIDENLRKEKEYNVMEEFSRDKKITEYFIQSFVIQNSDVLILVMNSMTNNEQILLNKIKKLCKFGKTIFVVHNLFNFVTVQQCEDYIEDTLMKSLTFSLDKLPMVKFDDTAAEKENNFFYRERSLKIEKEKEKEQEQTPEVNVVHLIMAFDDPNSEAGNYYNNACIQYLRNQITVQTSIKSFDFQGELKNFFMQRYQGFLENTFTNDDIVIEEKKLVLKGDEEGNLREIILKKCLVDELGEETFHESTFEPPYSYYVTEDSKLFVIVLEIPLCKQIEMQCKLINGMYYSFLISGIQTYDVNKAEQEIITWKREMGRFKLKFNIKIQDLRLKSRKHSSWTNENGIVKIYYEIEEEEEEDEEVAL